MQDGIIFVIVAVGGGLYGLFWALVATGKIDPRHFD